MAKHDIESEVTGNVWKVLLEAGATVAVGDVIIILESMKMEIPVEATVAGTLVKVLVAPEEQVEEDSNREMRGEGLERSNWRNETNEQGDEVGGGGEQYC